MDFGRFGASEHQPQQCKARAPRQHGRDLESKVDLGMDGISSKKHTRTLLTGIVWGSNLQRFVAGGLPIRLTL